MRKLVIGLVVCMAIRAGAQQVSAATDLAVMHNFSPKQQFWAIGHNLRTDVHFTKRETAYLGFTYFTPGSFTNHFTAVAKSSSVAPPTADYQVEGKLFYRQMVLGWIHYFKGSYNKEFGWSLYSLAGFGLMFSRAENIVGSIDTARYVPQPAPQSGSGHFNKLTVELGLAGEAPIGGDFFAYAEVRAWMPASSDPSKWLHDNKQVPLSLMASFGLRILFSRD